MFVQVIEGKVKDPDRLLRQVAEWREDVKPKAKGYLGSTSGITVDGYGITLARFASEAEARANSDLPEQGAWWAETAKTFDGAVTFRDCRDVDLLFGGGSNDAGFVQVMQGRAKDQEQMRRQQQGFEAELRKVRPDLMGAVTVWHGDGGFTQAAYFTSEQEARKNEKAMAKSPVSEQFVSLIDGDMTFFDLTRLDLD